MIKLIAIDLDGTLFDKEKNISEENKQAIKEAKEKGIYVVIATGRPYHGVYPVLKELNLLSDNDYVMCYNGAKIMNVGTQEVLFSRLINGKVVKELFAEANNYNLDIHAFRANEELITPKHNEYTDVEATINKITDHLYDFNKISDEDEFLKAMIVSSKDNLDTLETEINPKFYNDYSMVRSSNIFLEFLNKETDKGLALKHLAKYLNIDLSEVMALGDAGNDLNMIITAGCGVAMENGFPVVKQAAKYVTDTNENSGVGKAIRKYAL